MIFTSPVFLFLFFPICLLSCLAVYTLRGKGTWFNSVLMLFSLFFIAWWNVTHLMILLGSVLCNYTTGTAIQKTIEQSRKRRAAWLLAFGITANVALIFYFKYLDFAVAAPLRALGLFDGSFHFLLPLGISFFTFQQISFLVDVFRGDVKTDRFLEYVLFVTFFPHLIAGPIVLYSELMPQLRSKTWMDVPRDISIGLTIFIFGLSKKLIIADTLSTYVNPVYEQLGSGRLVDPTTIALVCVSYALQLYFDFSAYSDMAVGLARCVGITLPINFNSPYKATSITEFWRRWHMTLLRFFQQCFFQPVAVALTRVAARKRWKGLTFDAVAVVFPIVATFILVGIWHGAGWTFIVFGLLHGGWVSLEYEFGRSFSKRALRVSVPAVPTVLGRAFVFVFLATTLIIFRSPDLGIAARAAASFVSGAPPLPAPSWAVWTAMAAGLLIVWGMPNVYQIMSRFDPALLPAGLRLQPVNRRLFEWSLSPRHAVTVGVLAAAAVVMMGRGVVEFIYFNF